MKKETKPKTASPASQSISVALKLAILDSGLSIRQIATDSGVAHPVISRFMAGERDIYLATADKLAQHLSLTLDATK